jgi:hypothetical protein
MKIVINNLETPRGLRQNIGKTNKSGKMAGNRYTPMNA